LEILKHDINRKRNLKEFVKRFLFYASFLSIYDSARFINNEKMGNENRDNSPRNTQQEISLERDNSQGLSDFETLNNSIVSDV